MGNKTAVKVSIIIVIVFVIMLLCGCGEKQVFNKVGFYYWKTVFNLTSADTELMKKFRVSSLYVRMFDVSYDNVSGKHTFRQPVMNLKPVEGVVLFPVIFLLPDTFARGKGNDPKKAAAVIIKELDKLWKSQLVKYSEVQFDYDWSQGTKEAYFEFLKAAGEIYVKTGIKISVTVRLHQYKYWKKLGVPPSDRKKVMVYNMRDPQTFGELNTILNIKDMKSYIRGNVKYPEKVDVVLPVYSWYIQYNGGKIAGIFTDIPREQISEGGYFKRYKKNIFIAQKRVMIKGHEISAGDILKKECVTEKDLNRTLSHIKKNMNLSGELIYFGWDKNKIDEVGNETVYRNVISAVHSND
ncbi:MAG: hypothetical protein CVV21_02645 [Candidatus Goldiibacteriota bacterium HGW-Goldbacteria-1]|jgi:hypothetical protein|nr:MAG: hypothetical protein CVV21_02645 [Candidatus Goldiibacteriota bacterium HGW-Goldbacteria-1]